jgi:hypothetical protein
LGRRLPRSRSLLDLGAGGVGDRALLDQRGADSGGVGAVGPGFGGDLA